MKIRNMWSKFLRSFNKRDKYNKRDTDTTNYFPALCDDIMFDIFSRLPAESLLACKLVCPRWYGLITSDYFADKTYLNEGTRVVFMSSLSLKSCLDLFIIEDRHLKKTIQLRKIVLESESEKFLNRYALIASCNGLMLLRYRVVARNMPLVIYNPIIKEAVVVGGSAVGRFGNKIAHSFFLDKSTNEYKLILFEVEGKQTTYYVYGLRTKLCTTLYTCKFTPLLSHTSINLNRSVCWSVRHTDPITKPISECSRSIMIYNIVNESLRIIPNPRCDTNCFWVCNDGLMWRWNLGVINDKLVYCDVSILDKVSIWVLDNLSSGYSWIKQHEIYLGIEFIRLHPHCSYYFVHLEVLHVMNDMLLVTCNRRDLYWYSLSLKTIRKIHGTRHLRHYPVFCYCASGVKSFVSPKRILG